MLRLTRQGAEKLRGMTLASTEDTPHFGEVWMWEDMGPYMVISPSPLEGTLNLIVLNSHDLGRRDQGRLTNLYWHQPGRTFRAGWKRIDTEELGA